MRTANILARACSSNLSSTHFSPTQTMVDGLVENFVQQATDPKTLASLVAGGLAYRMAKVGVMGMNIGALGGSPLRVASVVFGLGSEVGAFEFTNRMLQTVGANLVFAPDIVSPRSGRSQGSPLQTQNSNLWSWNGQGGWKEALISDAITFGLLKGAGHLSRESNIILQHTFASSAMVAGHQTASRLGITPKPEGTLAEQLLYAEVTNLQMAAGSGLIYQFAPGLQAWERSLDLSLQIGKGVPSRFQEGSLFLQPALAEGKGALRDPKLIPIVSLMASSKESGGNFSPSKALVLKGESLDELPEIRKALLPQTREQLESLENLKDLLGPHGELLIKLNQAIGDLEHPAAAPHLSRLLLENLLTGKEASGLALHEHPLAQILAASLVAHYETIGDLIGKQMYRDLHTIFELLQSGEQKKGLEAEEIILQNLELDPFNPWYIRVGLHLSESLGELALQKPEHYKELQKKMEEIPERWKKSQLARSLEEKIVGGFRKKYLKTAKDVTGVYAIVIGVADAIFKIALGALTPGGYIKFAHYLLELMSGAKKAPAFLEEARQKTSCEIMLYYGDYRNAVPLSEPHSKLRPMWELLTRQKRGDDVGQEIVLEPIPQLNPHAVEQREALRELEQRLSRTKFLSLEGIPGSAKTYLAVQLANKYKNDPEHPVFWYTFRPGKKPNLNRALDHLAHFLEIQDPAAEHGLLAKVQDRASLKEKVDLLTAALSRTPTLLFFDNFHLILEDPEAVGFIQNLIPQGIGDSKVVTITRHSEDWLEKIGAQTWQREGLRYMEAYHLFSNLGILGKLNKDQIREAYMATKGRPMPLLLFGVLVKSGDGEAAGRLLEVLETKENRAQVLKYLFDQVYGQLGEDQKKVLHYLSIFRQAIPKEAFVFLGHSEEEKILSHLVSLEEVFLLEEPHTGLYELHERYKKLTALHFQDSTEFHRRAAEFYRAYAQNPSDYLEAAYHYFEAKEYDRSLRMIQGRTESLLNKGYHSLLEPLLQGFQESFLPKPEDRVLLGLEKGAWVEFQGDWKAALEAYRKALPTFKRVGDEEKQGEIYAKIASLHERLGEGKKALSFYDKALAPMAQRRDLQGMARIFHNMAWLYQNQGDPKRADQLYSESLRIKQELGDREGMATTFYHLGLMKRDQGKISEALEDFKKALEIYRELKTPGLASVEEIIEALEKNNSR